MTTPYEAEIHAAAHQHSLHAEAARERLAALARCCRSRAIQRAGQTLRTALARVTGTRSQCCTTA